uniref:threonine--tRNA ligase n=1 Tax=Mola mola TaxID=94237 RepID=A0A3Q3XF42_MOLML
CMLCRLWHRYHYPILKPWPGYIAERLTLYEELKRESDALMAKKAADSKPITVELSDGRKVVGKAWLTTPYQLACDIREGLADNAVISRVNGELWDLDRPLEHDCSLELLHFDNEDAQAVSTQNLVSDILKSWFPSMGNTGGSTSVSTNNNTSSILNTRVTIWREVTKSGMLL